MGARGAKAAWRLTEDQRRLAESHWKLVYTATRRLRAVLPQHAELIVDGGTDGLLEAARRWDESRHVRFGTYAHQMIRWRVADKLKRSGVLGYRDGTGDRAPAVLPLRGDRPGRWGVVGEDGHEALLALLAPYHARVLRWVCEEELGPREIARRLHSTRATARRRVGRAILALACALDGRGGDRARAGG
jgi:DNA-directed RNA polymerase specialized sigma24 family protein